MNMTSENKWMTALLFLLACLLAMPAGAQDEMELQALLDQMAEKSIHSQGTTLPGMRKGSINIPQVVDSLDLEGRTYNLSMGLDVKSSVRIKNGVIKAKANFSGGNCLVNIVDHENWVGSTVNVILEPTATIDASLASSSKCFGAVGIYRCNDPTFFHEQGDITAPDSGTGIAIYLGCANSTFNYVSGTLTGTIYNPYGGTVLGIGDDTFTKEQLLDKLSDIQADISTAEAIWNNANSLYSQLADRLPAADYAKVTSKMNELKAAIEALKTRRTNLVNQVNSADPSAYGQLNTLIEQLGADVVAFITSISAQIATLDEQVKGWAATDLGNRLSTAGSTLTGIGSTLDSYAAAIAAMTGASGNYYFEKLISTAFNNAAISVNADVVANNNTLNSLISEYNTLLRNNSINSVQEAINFYKKLETLNGKITSLQTAIATTQGEMETLRGQYDTLEVNFPDETENYSIRPSGLNAERQVGYKSNRGYVITSGGLLMFEQKEGADFYFIDQEGGYVQAKKGVATLFSVEDKEQATVWTGQSLGNGSYTFYSKTASRYLAFTAGTTVNAPVTTNTSAYAWKIVEPGLNELQAFLNILAEEDHEGQETPVEEMPTDTLVLNPPVYCFGCNYPTTPTPYVFPRVPYVIHLVGDGGELPIPRPATGNPGSNYHPIEIPYGSHVVIDNITLRDLTGGHHVIYVDGVLEITVTVNIYIQNWQWFIHVGPHGRVIWRNQGDTPLPIINYGTFDMADGQLGQLDNNGTVNHYGGTVIDIINRNNYYFTGGLAHHALNYGTFRHSGGQAITARNYEGATYEMSGGSIYNTVNNQTDTVFVNRGTFRFTGGIIRGYGKWLIWHGPNAYMRIDGGTFDFTYITHYFIEAHSDFYIRGNYNYGATKPIYLAPEVVIRLLYNWTYKFNIVFIDGRPVPRRPLFWGEGFTLTRNHYQYIGWDLPNHRWRWHVNETDNTIEPRDEKVYDEDDLQAYLDWLAENPGGEATSTESNPQVLDLEGREIQLTKPVTIPTGCHVFIKNGVFKPIVAPWGYDKLFIVPTGCSLRMDYVTVNMFSDTYYLVNGKPVQRCLFDIAGHAWFGKGFVVNGYYNKRYTATDTYIPGAMVNIAANGRVVIDGGVFNNVVLRLSNALGLYFRSAAAGYFHVYVPSAYRYNGFRIFGPWGGYIPQDGDGNLFNVINSGDADGDTAMAVDVDEEGYGELTDDFLIGDVNCDGIVSVTDVACITQYIMGTKPPVFRLAAADVNGDGDITISDVTALLNKVLN